LVNIQYYVAVGSAHIQHSSIMLSNAGQYSIFGGLQNSIFNIPIFDVAASLSFVHMVITICERYVVSKVFLGAYNI